MTSSSSAHFSILDGEAVSDKDNVEDKQCNSPLAPTLSIPTSPFFNEAEQDFGPSPPSPPSPPSSLPPTYVPRVISTSSSSSTTFHEPSNPFSRLQISNRLSALTASFVTAARQGSSQVARHGIRLGALARSRLNSSPPSPPSSFRRDSLPDLESVEPLRLPLTNRRVDLDVELLTYVLSFHCLTTAELVCKEWLEAARAARFVLRDVPCDIPAPTALEVLGRYSALQVICFSGVYCVTDSFLMEAVPIIEAHWTNKKDKSKLVLDLSGCIRLTDPSRAILDRFAEAQQGRVVVDFEDGDQEEKTHTGPKILLKGCYMMARLTPRISSCDMIRLQVLALRHPWDRTAGMAKAFTYASPENREATGPLSRFSRMINQGYEIMISASRACLYPDLVGMTGEAHAWVVRFDRGPETQSFLWVATSQDVSADEHPGCFMTSSVLPLRATGDTLDQKRWADARVPIYNYTSLHLPKNK